MSPELSVPWPQALAWRARRHLLDPVGDLPVAGVVRRLGAVLAMDPALAELAVRTRRRTSAPGELARALAAGDVVKVFAFRGSTHYLAPDDAGAYLAVRCAGRQWELPSWQEFYALAPAAWPGFREAVRDALADGPLTLAELGAAVTARPAYRHLRPVFDAGADTLVKPLTWQGDMAFGPPRGRQATFRRPDDDPRWGGVWGLDDGGRHAVRQHLATYGPADDEQVRYWLGEGLSAGAKRLRGWLDDLAPELVTVDVGGGPHHLLRADVEALLAAEPSGAVRFLPGHDQWVMGPGTKQTAVVPPGLRTAVTRKANLVTVDGVVRGTWAVRGEDLRLTGDLPPAELAAEVARLADLLGRPLRPVLPG